MLVYRVVVAAVFIAAGLAAELMSFTGWKPYFDNMTLYRKMKLKTARITNSVCGALLILYGVAVIIGWL